MSCFVLRKRRLSPVLVGPGPLGSALSPVFLVFLGLCVGSGAPAVAVDTPMLVTQLPASAPATEPPAHETWGLGMLDAEGARIVLVAPGAEPRVLTADFHSASDPAVSFDGTRFVFAAQRTAADDWNIYEYSLDGGEIRQITRDLGDCRSPCYQSTLFTLDSPEPWHQVAFVRRDPEAVVESGTGPLTRIYSCRMDGSEVRRLTYNLSSDKDPWMVWDGLVIFASWQRARLDRGPAGSMGLFGINLDGTDFALFACDQGAGERFKHMPCTTPEGWLVFVEGPRFPWDGAGSLAKVSLRRPLRSYRRLSGSDGWLYRAPSPLGDGGILVSRRPADASRPHGVYRLDLESGELRQVFDDPAFHDLQSRAVIPREEPDGRSSVVVPEDPRARLYGLDISVHDLPERDWLTPERAPRLRIIEGMPRQPPVSAAGDDPASPPLATRRILGETPIEADGSFHVDIPANRPLELQLLDERGMALRSCGWIWARNRENRGCIGCHEDGELTSQNRYVDALARPADVLDGLEVGATVDFRHDVYPIIEGTCVACHGEAGVQPHLADSQLPAGRGAYERLLARDGEDGQLYRYVDPGRARTSPLVWHLYGRNTARPWDGAAAERDFAALPAEDEPLLTEDQRRTVVQWIDLGAAWDARGVEPGSRER